MSFSETNRRRYPGHDKSRRMIGWGAVVALHLLIVWALVTGTARKGLEIIKKPLEAVVVQEVIIPPPPPPPPKQIKPPEPQAPKTEAPPPPFVPPPEVTPPSTAPSIASVATPPPTPPVIAPPPPPAAPPAAPGKVDIAVVCPTQVKPEMPRQAIKEGIEGVVKAQVLIGKDGAVKEVTILSGPRVYHSPVRAAMQQYKCLPAGAEVLATQEFGFKIE